MELLLVYIWRFCASYSQKSLPVIKWIIYWTGGVEVIAIPPVQLTHSYMEITCTLQSKALPHNQISYIWKGDPEYLGTLLFTRKFPRIKGFESALCHYINHKPCLSWDTKKILLSSCILEFLESLLLPT